jgi:hypothetical protein
MSDLDLRKLSAPIEALRADVKAAYERLDAKWSAITEQLRKLPIPFTVSHTLGQPPSNPEDRWCIEFRKYNGSKRICFTIYYGSNGPYGWEEECDVTPYDEWSGEQRVEMLKYVPDLFEAAEKQVKEFIEQTKLGEDA